MNSLYIQQKIIDKVYADIDRLNLVMQYEHQEIIKYPDINFNLHGITAGKAYLVDNELRFNLLFAYQDLERFLIDTVPHEVAHLFEWNKYGTVGHKKNWKYFMEKLGVQNPKRCHTYKQDSKCI